MIASSVSRRALISTAAAAVATSGIHRAYAAESSSNITGQLASYMAAARHTALPDNIALQCKLRILDTFAAMVSGARMKPGVAAIRYVRMQGGTPVASVVGAKFRTTAMNAALGNAMCAHADETDDFEAVTKAHPGCSTVPAALAMAEANGRSGQDMIRAVALGYDMGCRLLMALGPDLVRGTHRSAEGTAATFCAMGAAASLAELDERGMRYAISYAAQQESGLWSWVKDVDHIEKAFDFAGMGARNGVQAASMVQAGLTGVSDVLDGTNNLLIALSTQPNPQEMLRDLGSRYYVSLTAIKTYGVGYPIQSPVDAFLTLRNQYGLTPDNVKSVEVKLPTDAMGIVGDSAMPDVNCGHIIALALVRGGVSFADADDASLMQDPAILRQKAKVTVVGDQALMDPAAPRGAVVSVTMTDDKTVSHATRFPPGTKENPLDTNGVANKARGLMQPVLGKKKTEELIGRLLNLEREQNVEQLRPLFTV